MQQYLVLGRTSFNPREVGNTLRRLKKPTLNDELLDAVSIPEKWGIPFEGRKTLWITTTNLRVSIPEKWGIPFEDITTQPMMKTKMTVSIPEKWGIPFEGKFIKN